MTASRTVMPFFTECFAIFAAAFAGMSPSIVTPLNKVIGYEAAAKIAKHAVAKGITVREAVIDLGYVARGEITEAQLDEKLDLLSMTHAG